ncbi:MAG TPA: PEGA domain-containing protein [Candidatus Saccharibacteria bacterium]|nr:PEGA domain-containing protein [Candidatus Saccharibacteria bacterium]
MYRAPSKKRQLVQRLTAYTAMTAAVIVLVTIAVLLVLGYRFNRLSNTIEQGGLVQFISRPSGATITLGSATLAAQTPDKVTANPGNYNVTMAKDGYQSWTKNVTVKSAEVLWLNYAQLVPNDIKTSDVASFASLVQAVASPDGRYFALIKNAAKPELYILDTRSSSFEQKRITLPAGELTTSSASRFSLVEWSQNGKKILLTHKKRSATEYLVADIDRPEDSYNITSHFKLSVASAEFDPRSSDRLFVRTYDGDIRLVNINQDTISQVLLSKVARMSFIDDDALIYVEQVDAKTQRVSYLSLDKTTSRSLATYTGTKPVYAAAAHYFDDVYIAIAQGTKLTIRLANKLPSSDSTDALPLTVEHDIQMVGAPSYLTIRSGGRFVVVQQQKALTTYDLELHKHTATTFSTPLTRELGWLDRYHLYNVVDGNLTVFEFDGANQHDIVSTTPGYDAVQSSDGTYIYSFGVNSEKKIVLQRSRMILN